MLKRVFLIHGWGSKPDGGWRPWLKREFEKRGFDVLVPAMPEPDNPKMSAWVAHISEIVGEPDEDCYLVGHSLGATAILRYLESADDGKKIGGAVLVAGPVYREKLDEIRNFFVKPMEWEKIISHCSKFTAIYSDNDPLVSLENGELLREKLNANLITEHGMGHMSGAMDGVRELPSALKAVLDMEKE